MPAIRGRRPLIVAFHCSGGSGRQWRQLEEAAAGACEIVAPDLYGASGNRHWPGTRPFSLAEEAEPALGLIDAWPDEVHLVGHSYGGGVALKVAALRPHRIASLSLYEPSAFHLLARLGPAGAEAGREIRAVAATVEDGLLTGAYHLAARHFVDYWNGAGAWDAMKPERQQALAAYVPKAALDFRALLEETTPEPVYRRFGFPALVMRGEHAPLPTAVVADGLVRLLPRGRLDVLRGAGHMGPVTHAAEVAERIVAAVAGAELGHPGAQSAEAA
ncbi:alpha/beta fold hydrolase [Faunimonas sp. B44]|uniref:alpha/beta fold hydrolase n=1 Tax=Faunimonas sp. B44 TaxID=3461493 RepID=UPI004044CA85